MKRVIYGVAALALVGVIILLIARGSGAAPAGKSPERQVSAIDIQITAAAPPPPGAEVHQFPALVAGKIALHGFLTVLNPAGMLPGPENAIFLVPLEPGEGDPETIPQFNRDAGVAGVPQADVDERSGEFVFTGIAPGRWLVVVETINGAQIPARFSSGGLAIINLTEAEIDQVVELGYLNFP